MIKLGFIGCGFISQVAHLPNYAQIEGCVIEAIAEHHKDIRDEVARRYNVKKVYSNHEELLKKSNVDAVIVVVPRSETYKVVKDCLLSGKHVLSEKPMADTYLHAVELVDIARDKEVTYAVGFMRRYDKGIQKIRNLFNLYGDPIMLVSRCFGGYNYCNIDNYKKTKEKKENRYSYVPSWIPSNYKEEYLRFLNFYCHNINLIRFIVGELKVKYSSNNLIILDAGFPCVLEIGDCKYAKWEESFDIFFTKGYIKSNPVPSFLKNVETKIEVYDNDLDRTSIYGNGFSWSFKNQADQFIKNLNNGSVILNKASDCLEDMNIIEKIWEMRLK